MYCNLHTDKWNGIRRHKQRFNRSFNAKHYSRYYRDMINESWQDVWQKNPFTALQKIYIT